jgi:hypothetical protein
MYGGDSRHTFRSPYAGSASPLGLAQVAWNTSNSTLAHSYYVLGFLPTSTGINATRVLFFSSTISRPRSRVIAVDARSGSPLWSVVPPSLLRPGVPVPCPALSPDGALLYLGPCGQVLLAVSTRTGELVRGRRDE